MLSSIRLISQQLYRPSFKNPEDLLDWMGAIQAQDYTKSKWAMGVRLKNSKLADINKAYEEGRIVRTHIMRPTWHLVSGKDIRWMLKLTAVRTRAGIESWAKGHVPEGLYLKCIPTLEKMLGGEYLTKQELTERFLKDKLLSKENIISYVLSCAETDGIICSGPDKGGKSTFALLEDRVAPAPELTRDESLALLALKYFRSHSPATLTDFNWWTGLTMTDSKKAIELIKDQLIEERIGEYTVYIHESCGRSCRKKEIIHLLPAYDEYLISYKDRSGVLNPEHYPKAFNNFGIFHNVILFQGRIVGNWERSVKKGRIECKPTLFINDFSIPDELFEKATERYRRFYG